MRKLWTFLFAMAIIVSCGDTDPSAKSSDTYTIKRVFDIGNSGSPTDIRVHFDFKVGTILSEISHVRLVFVPGSKGLSKEKAESLDLGSFFELTVSSTSHQVAKVDTDIKDAESKPITNGAYTAYIVVLKVDGKIEVSKGEKFTLSDSPIYVGDYIGTWEDLGPPGPAKFSMSLRIADDYSGKMFYANADFKPFGTGSEDATTTLTVDGALISSFVLNQLIGDYKGGCAASGTLTGTVEDDINLVLYTFSWSDCDGTRDVKLKFTKQ